MVITLTNQSAFSPNQAKRAGHSFRTRFMGTPDTVKAMAEKEITHLSTAKQMKKLVDKLGLTKDIRAGGLSLEDVAGRLQTLIGVYILQGYYAAKEHKHPYETNGRNAVVWLMTLALTAWSKSENFGVNTLLLNPIMQKKGTASKIPGMQKVLDQLRMDADYFDIIEKAGIKVSDAEKIGAQKGKKALWASGWLDTNRIEQIQNLEKKLKAESVELAKKGKKLGEKDADILKSIPGFFKRVNTFNIASTAIITAATVYFIGGVAMKIVNKVFTPLDNNPNDKDKTDKAKPQSSGQPAEAAQPAPMSTAMRPQPPFAQPIMPTMQMLSQPSLPSMPLPFLPPLPLMPPRLGPAALPPTMSPNLLNRPVFPGPFANQQPGGLN